MSDAQPDADEVAAAFAAFEAEHEAIRESVAALPLEEREAAYRERCLARYDGAVVTTVSGRSDDPDEHVFTACRLREDGRHEELVESGPGAKERVEAWIARPAREHARRTRRGTPAPRRHASSRRGTSRARRSTRRTPSRSPGGGGSDGSEPGPGDPPGPHPHHLVDRRAALCRADGDRRHGRLVLPGTPVAALRPACLPLATSAGVLAGVIA